MATAATSNKQQATSNKQQATNNKQQATSNKQQATASNRWAADRRHPGVAGPNLVGMSALARGPFGLSLGPWAIGVPEISN